VEALALSTFKRAQKRGAEKLDREGRVVVVPLPTDLKSDPKS
jgi:hypothetical protein